MCLTLHLKEMIYLDDAFYVFISHQMLLFSKLSFFYQSQKTFSYNIFLCCCKHTSLIVYVVFIVLNRAYAFMLLSAGEKVDKCLGKFFIVVQAMDRSSIRLSQWLSPTIKLDIILFT